MSAVPMTREQHLKLAQNATPGSMWHLSPEQMQMLSQTSQQPNSGGGLNNTGATKLGDPSQIPQTALSNLTASPVAVNQLQPQGQVLKPTVRPGGNVIRGGTGALPQQPGMGLNMNLDPNSMLDRLNNLTPEEMQTLRESTVTIGIPEQAGGNVIRGGTGALPQQGGFDSRGGMTYGQMSDYAQTGQIPTQPMGDPNYNPNQILPGRLPPSAQPQQQYGLSGQEAAIQGGVQAGLGALGGAVDQAGQTMMGGFNQAMDLLNKGSSALAGGQAKGLKEIGSAIDQGVNTLNPFVQPGQQAQQRQAALSGALGGEAQAQAFKEFNESPGQAFLREQGERALINQAAATGGTQGGRVLQELQRQGIGLAQQDFQNQFNRLGQVTGQGLQAAGQIGQLRGQQAGLSGNLIGQTAANQASLMGQGAGMAGNMASQLGGMQFGAGQQALGALTGAGSQIGQARGQAGRDIAGQVTGTTANLADLINRQGQGLSDITGQGASSISDLLRQAGIQTGQGQQDLAKLLSGISTQGGQSLAQLLQNRGYQASDTARRGGENAGNLVADIFGQLLGGFGFGG